MRRVRFFRGAERTAPERRIECMGAGVSRDDHQARGPRGRGLLHCFAVGTQRNFTSCQTI